MRTMLDKIRHRGPDDEGLYVESHIGLGHRRLSIVDLSAGHQPLSNEDGTIWIIFNGEIYNFRDLRVFLISKGHVFATQTDTEVIIHLYEELGTQCLEKLRGMFAFAIWDVRKKTLFLARDRVGIKPLYYYLTDTFITFASEIKALLVDPSVDRQVATEVLDRYLTFHYIPGEETLLRRIKKLAPGHYLLIRNRHVEIRQYWDLQFTNPRTTLNFRDTEAQLLALLSDTVRLHTLADVPVGVLLSGGIDSSAVLSFAAQRNEKVINSYTVGFSANGISDERYYARVAANAYGSRHHDTTISAKDFVEFMPQYVWYMDEPICEPPAIALYYVSRLASREVKVLLSGEGGDEAFAGYGNYLKLLWLERVKAAVSVLSPSVRGALSAVNLLFRVPQLREGVALMNASFPSYYFSRTSNPYWYNEGGFGTLYSAEFARSIDREQTLEPVRRLQAKVQTDDPLNAMLYIDTKTWLPDDLLIKADRMTMANSVELRVPLLDHKILEFAATLPPSLKIRRFSTKYVLKRLLRQRVPKEILGRSKAGFPVPYDSWLERELRGWARDILLDRATLQRGYFDHRNVERLLSQPVGHNRSSKQIFALATLELWHRAFAD